jgi:predicted metal-dependent peptidase
MDARIEKKRLFDAIPIEQEILDEATLALKEARRYLGLGPSVITSIVVGLCHFTFTRTIDTFAVKLAADGNPMLMINPDFLIKIGPQQAVFALSHEAYHLLLVHLYTDPELMKNQNWVLATEACINYRIKKHLKLPLIQIDGKVAIVDPDKIYDSYRTGMKKIELEPVSREDFFATDLGCFAQLESLPKPVNSKQSGCVHVSDSQSGTNNAPLDPSEVSKFMDKVLSGAIQSAKNGRQGAKEEILNWMDSSPEASQTWGDLGAGTLRGETTKSRKTDLWEKWTADAIGTRLRDGNRWRYNRKIHWDPRVSANGKQPHKYGAVFIDASGSMHQEVLDRVASMIGDLDDITVQWHSFDGSVWPFKTGEGFKGGGGTSFHVIEDHVSNNVLADDTSEHCCDEELDFVLVLTDGYAQELIPSSPEKWIWLIVPGGTTWPLDAGMSCREIDPINQ